MPQKNEDESCRSPFHVMRAGVRHTESKGVGYKDGYTTLEGFGIYDRNPYFMPFLDLRGHVFNDGQLAGNVGLGERTVIPSINHLFGLYLYYDVRQEDHGLTVNQLSPGVEMLGKRMEYRVNAYFPVGRDESPAYHRKFGRFQGNRILLQQKKKFAMTGADAEVGAHMPQTTRHDFYFGIGPYYFTADPHNAWGGKTRLYWRYKDYVSLEASYSYDHIFKNIVQGTAAFSYPFGPKLKRQGRNCPNSNDLALSRAAFAPYRFEIPVVETRKQYKTAMNPAIGRPWKVWFVNNTSHSAGTYESPFSTLADAQNASGPSDMIYVLPGDGTSRGMDMGITLQNGQTLFGSGTAQTLRTQFGRVRIPAFSAGAPTLTNANPPALVTLADGNEISGFVFTTPSPITLIRSPGNLTINGVNIHNNVFNVSSNSLGIDVTVQGTNTIKNNIFLGGNNSTGIHVGVGPSEKLIKINITNNSLSNFGNSIFMDQQISPSSATTDTTIVGNRLIGFITGLVFTGVENQNSILRVRDNVMDTQSTGVIPLQISLGVNPSVVDSGRFFIDNNVIVGISNFPSQNIVITDISPFARLSITNNVLAVGSTAASTGVTIIIPLGGTLCSTIANNRIQFSGSSATTHGMLIAGPANAIVNIDDFSNNVIPGITTNGNPSINFVTPGTCKK